MAEKSTEAYEIVTKKGNKVKIWIDRGPLIVTIVDVEASKEYGIRENTKKIQVDGMIEKDISLVTMIKWERR